MLQSVCWFGFVRSEHLAAALLEHRRQPIVHYQQRCAHASQGCVIALDSALTEPDHHC